MTGATRQAGSAPAGASPAAGGDAESAIGESPWPAAAVVLLFMAMNVALRIWLPRQGVFQLKWLIPALEATLVVLLVASRPGSPAERARLRRLALALVILFVLAALWDTALLVSDLVTGEGVANHADQLLATGGEVWLGNNLAFALLYWLMDGGGPIARTRRAVPVDFAFTQHMSPELARPGWKPVFFDYLHLGFTNATAFSPTDVMPLTHRAKLAMVVQATVALAVFGLVVARAVNAFT